MRKGERTSECSQRPAGEISLVVRAEHAALVLELSNHSVVVVDILFYSVAQPQSIQVEDERAAAAEDISWRLAARPLSNPRYSISKRW
jgi:hypothetical protein